MAVKTWDTSRVGGGTYELQRDATTGNYSLKSVEFDQVNKLNLPDLLTQDATTTTTTTQNTNTTTGTTTDTSSPYKQLAKANLGGDTQQDYTGSMLKNQNTATDTTTSMTTGSTGDGPWTMRSEGGQFPGRSRVDPTTTTGAWDKGQWGPQASEGMVKNQDDSWERGDWKSYAGITDNKDRFQGESEIYKNMDDDTASLLPGQSAESVKQSDRFASGKQWGPKPSSGMPTENIKGRSKTEGGKALGITSDRVPDAIKAGQPAAPDRVTGLQKVKSKASDTLKKLGTAVQVFSPVIGMLKEVGRPVNESAAAVKLNKSYFNVRKGDTTGQRIAGNPATDLYAGMNRVSKYGNLEKAGAKRISTREKTIAKYEGKWDKAKMDNFKATTNKMKNDQKDYKEAKKAAPVTGTTKPGTSGGANNGGGNKRVICTELHRTGEMSTVDWIRDIKFTYKNLSKDHIKGYLFWAVPTVKHIQKYPRYRKVWKHIAQHRANDIAWRLNQGKFDLLGRIYAGIGEPLCWLIGKCVSDKQLKELKLNSWRRA